MFIGKSNMAVAVTFLRERLPTTSVLWDHALPQYLCCGLGSLTSLKLWVCGMWEFGVYKPSSRNSGVTSYFAFVVNTRTLNWFAYYFLCSYFPNFIELHSYSKNFCIHAKREKGTCRIPRHLRVKNLRFFFIVFMVSVKLSLSLSHVYI